MKAEEFLINNAVICKFADGSGNDMVTLDDAKQSINIANNEAVKKWIYFGFNASSTQINAMLRDIAGEDYNPDYLREKYARHGYDLNRYYCECDSTLRKRMVDWVMANYNG